MKKVKVTLVSLAFALGCVIPATAQDSFEVSVGADLVSSYQWRGQSIAGASFQPGASISYKGISLGAWGSTELGRFLNIGEDGLEGVAAINEFDWTLGYEISGFSVAITDYYGPYTDNSVKYFAKGAHILEGTVGFDFSSVTEKFPLTIAWNTNFYNDVLKSDATSDKDYAYSTYIELGYPVKVGEVGLDFAVGLTPWYGAYSDNFNVVNLSIKASKDIKITDSFSLPLFGQIAVNPNTESAHFVVGLSF
ncbi:MAG: hypothetical protein LBN27_04560 [Prevotellaceae bacterium]|jgi:hypothetical protein|nr:hypothetical protein [Prevotellaceae bacterium]